MDRGVITHLVGEWGEGAMARNMGEEEFLMAITLARYIRSDLRLGRWAGTGARAKTEVLHQLFWETEKKREETASSSYWFVTLQCTAQLGYPLGCYNWRRYYKNKSQDICLYSLGTKCALPSISTPTPPLPSRTGTRPGPLMVTISYEIDSLSSHRSLPSLQHIF